MVSGPAFGQPRPEFVAQEHERRDLMIVAPVDVLAVDDARLVRMQLQPDLFQPTRDRIPHLAGLLLAVAVHHRIVAVAFERDGREFPHHPCVERVVHEQVRQQRARSPTPVGCRDPGRSGCRLAGPAALAATAAHTAGSTAGRVKYGGRPPFPRGPRARCRRISGCRDRSPSPLASTAGGRSRPRPTRICPAGSRRNPDGRSARPSAPHTSAPLSGRSGRPRWHAEHPDPIAVRFRYLNRHHRRRK